MELALFDQKGKKLEEKVTLNPSIFELPENKTLIAQYVRVFLANNRQGNASSKMRGEVSGGGIKPWKQKGTGRARQGSIRSPLWVGGGVVHGPKPRDYSLKMPVTMKRKALFTALSMLAKESLIAILDTLKMAEFKTKKMAELNASLKKTILDNKKLLNKKTLLVLPEMDKKLISSARNIDNLEVVQARDLNAYMLLSSDLLIMPKESLKVIEETFLTK
ncbi:50S ribosomal protein L4 [candidate division WWE3 bacterium CG08_land_8_20_14_0_20_41_15]|uniref:Large ribosomal subunit protein uL4 n=1 Tax=candidate division WWE3 bacterium CG08_land_8_20_14_0_20_41_15 TaxID=1975086 RepID=A0A2H0X8X0_UNCKA|nr:MAG: 50S ribosomal protein L4 [candidate division WWE3 bacterium CG08_land_8_20_14_0_20_41_15]